jgi:hypothetical protein
MATDFLTQLSILQEDLADFKHSILASIDQSVIGSPAVRPPKSPPPAPSPRRAGIYTPVKETPIVFSDDEEPESSQSAETSAHPDDSEASSTFSLFDERPQPRIVNQELPPSKKKAHRKRPPLSIYIISDEKELLGDSDELNDFRDILASSSEEESDSASGVSPKGIDTFDDDDL